MRALWHGKNGREMATSELKYRGVRAGTIIGQLRNVNLVTLFSLSTGTNLTPPQG
jgi:hypothetical protein